jgi:hypothetical protein
MIGVIAKVSEAPAVREFFELFKTPWEFYVPERTYDVVLVTADEVPGRPNAKVLIVYNSRPLPSDNGAKVQPLSAGQHQWAVLDQLEFPLYGFASTVQDNGTALLTLKGRSEALATLLEGPKQKKARVGYDLFREIGVLLSRGQPPENASIPTLELHIQLLRNIMISAGVPFVEIPPAPEGFACMACLSHDVDFIGIRDHKFDVTTAGFLYRATLGSLKNALWGRLSWSRCWTNWKAVLRLPFVHLGWAEDFWLEFERFSAIEAGLGSTYYFIPFNNYPGTLRQGKAPSRRAAKYDLLANTDEIRKLREQGCEVGLHGLDAWQSPDKGQQEFARIQQVTGQDTAGIRMHWLYFDEKSPKALEEAGFLYDSTFGYNDAIGFRAGTSQVFCMPSTGSFMELPLIVQDTAMLYPDRMHLSEQQALDRCKVVIERSAKFGGVLTINWHTRSLSPERLWGDFYLSLLQEIKKYRVRFATALQLVDWFKSRRAIRFEQVVFTEENLRVRMDAPVLNMDLPFVLRVYNAHLEAPGSEPTPPYVDFPWKNEIEVSTASRAQGDQIRI